MKKLTLSNNERSILIPAIKKRIEYCRNDAWIQNIKKQQRRLIWLDTFIQEIEFGEAYIRPITRAEIQGIIQEYLLDLSDKKRIQFIQNGFTDSDIQEVMKINLYNTIFNKFLKRGTTKKSMIALPTTFEY